MLHAVRTATASPFDRSSESRRDVPPKQAFATDAIVIPTVLWTLRNGAKQLTCSVQLLPHGLELHLALNGDTPLLQPHLSGG